MSQAEYRICCRVLTASPPIVGLRPTGSGGYRRKWIPFSPAPTLFKRRVMTIEQRCRITGVDNPIHLVASHCKPWRDCESNEERLDGENGLLLTPSIDHLFDRGFIGFETSGRLIISPVAHLPSLLRMGVETQRSVTVGGFTAGQRRFLDFHRNKVLLRSMQ